MRMNCGRFAEDFYLLNRLSNLMVKVESLMTKKALTIESHKTIFEAAQLMSQKEVGDLIVVENEIPVGIVTERDFVRRVIARGRDPNSEVSDVMSKPLITISPDASINAAARKMMKKGIRRLPVIQNHKLVGIIVVSDFARHIGKKTFTEGILEAIWRRPMGEA